MVDALSNSVVDLHATAVAKLTRVLGDARGHTVFAEAMRRVDLGRIDTADHLFRLGQHLEQQGGFVATVGALLCLTAVMHGAAGRAR